MKLVRYGQPGSEKPGLIDADGKIRDLSAHIADLKGDALSPASLAKMMLMLIVAEKLHDGSLKLPDNMAETLRPATTRSQAQRPTAIRHGRSHDARAPAPRRRSDTSSP